MCGLTGIILKQQPRKKKELELISKSFENMLKEANTRGGHATGFAIIDKHGDYVICKKAKDAFDFFDDYEVHENIEIFYEDVTCLMGHTRYATLGSPQINKNNHPIRAGKTIGTHNGSIHNHKKLFKKYNMVRYAQVDSEAIFRLYETSQNSKDFSDNRLPDVRGKVAIVWADLDFPEYVYIVKANNPLEIGFISSLNIFIYGSTKEIINSANLGEYEPINVEPNTMLRINTSNLRIRSKSIKIQKPKPPKFSYYNSKIGAYEKLYNAPKYSNTVSNFVPRYSYKDQTELFKKYKAQDGSTIRKIK